MADNISRITNKSLSQLDPGGVLRNAHDYEGNSLRVRDTVSVVKDFFTHYRATLDGNDLPTQVTYLRGTAPHITQVGTVSDVAGSLNSTYFFIYDGTSDKQFYIWFNVSGGGVDPNITDSIGIEVPINTNDDKSIVALAIELAINADSRGCRTFDARRINGVTKITSKKFGETANSIDGTTGFLITNEPGEEKVVDVVDIEYDASGEPVWEGQVLPGYKFNIFTGKFELLGDAGTVTVNFDPVTGQDPQIINLALGLAGTEGSALIPSGAIQYLVKPRNTTKLQFSYVSGQSGTNFLTIKKGAFYSEENLKLSADTTIYIQAPDDDNATVEILYWT